MATILRIRKNSSTLLTLNDDSAYSHLSGVPREAEFHDGAIDLSKTVESVFELLLLGASKDALIENRAALERALMDGWKYQNDVNDGAFMELEFAPNGATNALYAELRGGWVEGPKTADDKNAAGTYAQRVVVHILHRPTWEAAETSITLTTTPSNLSTGNVAVLPTLVGTLPARCKIYATFSGGNASSLKRLVAALRARQTIASFSQQILVAGMGTGWTITAGSMTAISADANFISGSKARYTPTDTLLNELVRWEYAPATVSDTLNQFVNALSILRYRENTSTGNFKVYLQNGVKIGSTYVYGVAPDLAKTKYSGGTNEIGALDLGIGRTPGLGSNTQAVVTLVWRLMAQASQTGGSRTLDIDCVARFPYGEGMPGKGLAFAEYPAAISSNRAYLDFYRNRDRAYLADTSGNKLSMASDWVDGGEIWLAPQVSGQRLYFGAFTAANDSFKWDKTTSIASLVLTYRPHYLSWRGNST